MEITTRLRQWLVANCGVAETASETLLRSVLAEAIQLGKLTLEKVAELSGPSGGELTTERKKKLLSRLAKDLRDAGELGDSRAILAMAEDGDGDNFEGRLVHSEAELEAMSKAAEATFRENVKKYGLIYPHAGESEPSAKSGTEKRGNAMANTPYINNNEPLRKAGTFHPHEIFTAGSAHEVGDSEDIRVKDPSERLSSKKWTAKHVKTGEPMAHPRTGEACTTTSDQEYAKCGVLVKMLARKQMGWGVPLSEFEKALYREMVERDTWIHAPNPDRDEAAILAPGGIKAILDDATSGGAEAVPIVVDDQAVTFPVLFGEIMPLVTVVNVARGSSVEGFSIGNPTITSNTAEGSAITLFNTASLIQAIDTSIFTASVGVEIGRDFLSDAVVDIGRVVMNNIGQKWMEWLDNQLINGDGTTEPEGCLNASSTNVVSFGNGTTGDVEVADIENLVSAIGKQYRPRNDGRVVFVSSDTSYFRARGVKVGSSDERRIFGMTHEDYMVMSRSWRVQNDMGNANHIFGNFGKYRLYRRLGQTFDMTTAGETLTKKNTALLTSRGRYGGQVVDPNAFAVASNGKP